MQALRQFSIPLKGLKNGKHDYVFNIDKTFFDSFESSPVESGKLEAKVSLDKKSDHIVLDFWIDGTVKTECDRCTASIDLPIDGQSEVILKFSDEEQEEGEVVFLSFDAHEYNLAALIYETIVLSIPMIKVYDCDLETTIPCNLEILNYLSGETKVSGSPLGDALKNLKLNKN